MAAPSGALEITADLASGVEVPGRASLRGTLPGRGTLSGRGSHLDLRVDDPTAFGGRADSDAVRGAWTGLRARADAPNQAILPDASLAPPSTLTPLAPTFVRLPRRPVTTTHDPRGGGSPRLVPAPRPAGTGS